MAQRRLKLLVEPPSTLTVFDPEEWEAPDDHASWQAFGRWKDARHQWVKAHGPDSSLGSMVDVFRDERALWETRNGYVADRA